VLALLGKVFQETGAQMSRIAFHDTSWPMTATP
jgi:hypothetical protein